MIAKLKELAANNTVRFALIAVCVAVVCILFWNWIVEILIGLFGLGAVAVAAKKQQAKDSTIIAKEHEVLKDNSVKQAVKDMKEADDLRQAALKKAESIKPLPETPKLNKKRKKFPIK